MPALRLFSLLHNGFQGLFPGVKRPNRGADHSLPSSAEVKWRVELYLSPNLWLRGILEGELWLHGISHFSEVDLTDRVPLSEVFGHNLTAQSNLSTQISPSTGNDFFEPHILGNSAVNRPLYPRRHYVYITYCNYFNCYFCVNHTCTSTWQTHCKSEVSIQIRQFYIFPHSSEFLCCSIYCLSCVVVYCLCVNVYCTTATGWLPNCN